MITRNDTKKTILFNASGLSKLDSKGGAIEKVVSNQINYLTKEFKIVIFGQKIESNSDVISVPYERRIYLDRGHLFEDTLYMFFGFFKILNINSDIIISTHQRNFFLSFLYSKIKRIPLIAEELDHDFWVHSYTNGILKIYHRLIQKSNCIITESLEQKRRMVRIGIDENKIRIVYLGIDTNKYSPNHKVKSNIILYVAKFTNRKNQLSLLQQFHKVVSKYSDFKLVLVGPKSGAFSALNKKPSDYYHQCLNFITYNKLDKNVIIKENLSEYELIELYQEAMIFIFPSIEEAFGLALLEAMACGCCCISNNIEPMKEILSDAGMFVDVSSDYSNNIIDLIEKEDLRKKLEQLARKRTEKVFDLDIVSLDMKRIIEGLLCA